MAQLMTGRRNSAPTPQARPAHPARPRLVIENLDGAGPDTALFTICIVAASSAQAGLAAGRLEA
jgi:hypothetical protein